MKIPLLTLDKPNKNNRIYPTAVMEKAIAKYKEEFIDMNRSVVTNKIPDSDTVNLADTVGLVTEIKTEGDTVFANVVFFPKMNGALIAEAGLQSGKLSLRSHGLGTLTKQADGTYLVGEDYEIISCFLTHE